MAGGIRWILLFIIIPLLMVPLSSARMGYDIKAFAGGSAFEISRTTTNLDFSLDGAVSGKGNFSRLNSIDGFAGIKTKEQISCTKESDLNYSEQLRLSSREGPVVVTVNLQTTNITNVSKSSFVIEESSHVKVDEIWPTLFANLKRISYFGPGMKMHERYENNGDVVSSYTDSWKLSKTSLYQATYNRTIVDADITPLGVISDKSSNQSSSYLLGMQFIGSFNHLDLVQHGSVDGNINRISQDYKGQQNISLRVGMNSYVLKQPNETIAWLPCCPINSTFGKAKSGALFQIG